LLNAVAQTIPAQDRIVLIEETSDSHRQAQSRSVRGATSSGAAGRRAMPAVTIADLVQRRFAIVPIASS
jgi:type IV secretory pathway ATPase VirB11/archaellum biosynthesis ATPase